MHFLSSITEENFNDIPLPIEEILAKSTFYPAAGTDWNLMREVNTYEKDVNVRSFIYADYLIGRERVLEELDKVQCYKVLMTKSLNLEDIVPEHFDMSDLPGFNDYEYFKHSNNYKPFAQWTIYERQEDCGDHMGPSRFSLLYLGTEGVKAYRALYWLYNEAPDILTVVQSGEGFGGGYSGFRDLLRTAVNNIPCGKLPKKVYYGGQVDEPERYVLDWPGYQLEKSIREYYWSEVRDHGTVNVYVSQ